MSEFIKWTKLDGQEVVTNDLPDNIEAAEKLGWKRKDSKRGPGRPPKQKDPE